MVTKKFISSSCCGKKSFIIELDKAIRKSQISFFKDAGYLVPDCFFDNGVFWVQSASRALIATGSFGTTRLSLQCSGLTCDTQIAEFEALIEKAIQVR